MAHPRNIGTHGGTTSGNTGGTVGPLIEPNELQQIQLLEEAVLVSFAATPTALKPFARATLEWNIIMPTTVIPGVTVEVVIEGLGGDLEGAGPHGTIIVAPFTETVFGVALRTPLAYRELSTLTLPVDLSACRSQDLPLRDSFTNPVKAAARDSFQGNSQLRLREDVSIDVGINSFVLFIPLEAEIPDWRNANVDVTISFEILTQHDGSVSAKLGTAHAAVIPGPLSTIGSLGCATVVADACEAVIDGFLWACVGPMIAANLAAALNSGVKDLFDHTQFQLYDYSLTEVGITLKICPLN